MSMIVDWTLFMLPLFFNDFLTLFVLALSATGFNAWMLLHSIFFFLILNPFFALEDLFLVMKKNV